MSKLRGSLFNVSSITILTLIGQLLAFGREAVFAAIFGLSYQADAYVIATQIPVTLFAVVGVGITTAFLPIYTQKLHQNNNISASQFLNNAGTVFIGISVLFAVLGVLFAEQIVHIFAPTYSGELQSLTIILTKISFIAVIFTTFINILKAVHHAWESFTIPVVITYITSIIVIISITIWGNKYGTLAPIIGTLVALLIQSLVIQCSIKKKYMWEPKLDLSDPDLKRILLLISPIILGVGIAEINKIIDRVLATGLSSGNVAALNYSSKLVGVISGLIVAGLGVVSYQKLSKIHAKNDYRKMIKMINNFLSATAIITIPVSIGMIMLSEELISIVYGRGAFTIQAIELTSVIFIFYSLGLFFVVIRDILTKAYYSMNDTKTPMINSAIGVVINMILNVILIHYIGAAGLALATSISSIFICILLFISMYRKFNRPSFGEFYLSLLKCILAGLFMIIILSIVPIINSLGLKVLLFSVVGGLTYFSFLILLKEKITIEVLNKMINGLK